MSVAVEAAIVLPAVMLLVGLIILLAGQALMQQQVDSTAYQAARAASLETTPEAARRAANQVAIAELSSFGISCKDPVIDVDASGLNAPVGSTAQVQVTVRCTAHFPISLPGFPSHKAIHAHGSSPVDTYRGR